MYSSTNVFNIRNFCCFWWRECVLYIWYWMFFLFAQCTLLGSLSFSFGKCHVCYIYLLVYAYKWKDVHHKFFSEHLYKTCKYSLKFLLVGWEFQMAGYQITGGLLCMNHIIMEVIETELHPNNMNRKDGVFLCESVIHSFIYLYIPLIHTRLKTLGYRNCHINIKH
jgi:hypothetical protein